MACNQTLSGLVKDCTPSVGGIVEVYIIDRELVSGVEAFQGIINEIVTLDEARFKKYQFARNTGSMTSTYNINIENGTKYVSTDVTLVFNRMETAKRVEIVALAQSDLALIVKDANGKYWYLGMDEPVVMTAGDIQTGTARADRNGYSVTLQDNAKEPPYEVEEGIVIGLIE